MKHVISPICRAPGKTERISKSLTLFLAGACFGVSVAILPSCAQTLGFLRSPIGQTIVSAGGALIVKEAVEARPELAPVMSALAEHQLTGNIDFSQFDQPLYGLGILTVNQIEDHYGNDASSRLIADSINVGLELARPVLLQGSK